MSAFDRPCQFLNPRKYPRTVTEAPAEFSKKRAARVEARGPKRSAWYGISSRKSKQRLSLRADSDKLPLARQAVQ